MPDKNSVEVPPKNKSSNSNKKVIIIVLVVIVVLFVLPAILVGGFFWFIAANSQNIINNATKDGISITTGDGSKFEVSSQKLPEGFPSEIPLYSGQVVTGSSRSSADGVTDWYVVAESKDSKSAVSSSFSSKLSGWEKVSEYESNGATVTDYKKGDLTLTVTISDSTADGYVTNIVYIAKK